MSASPELVDYIAFFEAEPTNVNPEGWYYGAEFNSVRGTDRLWAAIAPDEGEFSLKWWQSGGLRFDLHLKGVVAWALDADPRIERLRLKFHDSQFVYFELQLKPQITLTCATEWA